MKTEIISICVVLLGLLALSESTLAEWTEPVPVTEVNTYLRDIQPFLSYDGLTLYFARRNGASSIYAATRDEPFGPFTSVTEILSSYGQVFSPWVSPDNLRMYYHQEAGGWLLKMSERASVEEPWPQGTSVPEINALGRIHSPKLTADELVIFFSSPDIPGGLGEYDIWMASRPDRYSPFGDVRNLTEINTSSSEMYPFVSPEGLTLYFSSNRNGSSQLFKVTRDSLSEPFGDVEHLSFFDTPGGHSVQPCVSSDGTTIYFARFLNGEDPDIYVSYLIPYEVAVDIKPTSCPNPLNLGSMGVLPVAVLGEEDFDVNTIDITSIHLLDVTPLRSSYEDVAGPVLAGDECECTTAGPDGYTDLTLKFKTTLIVEEILNAFGDITNGEVLILDLTGLLSDGTAISGSDCIVVVGRVPPSIHAKKFKH